MPVSSSYPDITLSDSDLVSFLLKRDNLPFKPDKVIYEDADNPTRQYTYERIRQLALDFSQSLTKEYHIRKGDRIVVVTPNDIDFPPVVLGILASGAVVSPVNPGYTASELAYQLKDSGARLIVTHESALDTVQRAGSEVGIDKTKILLLGTATSHPQIKHWTASQSRNGRASVAQISQTNSSLTFKAKDDLAFLAYSSGTTGKPKGVMLTHRNITSNILQITACEAGKLSSTGSKRVNGIPDAPPSGDKVLSCLPFFHIYGLTSLVMAPLYNGIHTIVLAKFEIEKFCRLVQEHAITFSYIVPPMALLLAKDPRVSSYDLSSIRMTNSGAAPLTKELQQAVFQRTGTRIKQGYGLSETSPTTHEQRWEDWNINIGTIGRLQPNMQAKICEAGDESTKAVPKELKAGEIGELYLKGPNVFKGYWRNEAATAQCLTDGWFRTGDIGYVNSEGDFFITDRLKELIKYKGFQVAPAELEGYLVDHEFVDDVVVVGVESKVLGTEVPRAYIVRKGGVAHAGDDARIVEWLNGRVANHKKLRGGVKFVDTIPKSPSGKLLRRLIRDEAGREFAQIESRQGRAKL